MKKKLFFISLLFAAPAVTMAQNTSVSTGYIEGAIEAILNVLGQLPVVIIALATIVFLWGVLRFMLAGDDEEARSAGRKTIGWGLIALVVMFSLWGIVKALQILFFGSNVDIDAPDTPSIPGAAMIERDSSAV
jgi:ribose/xylose/arabinose/galactoside ABC-type transport system permease subunit